MNTSIVDGNESVHSYRFQRTDRTRRLARPSRFMLLDRKASLHRLYMLKIHDCHRLRVLTLLGRHRPRVLC